MKKSNKSTSSSMPERKVIEKNRRNKMKILYSQLFSLIPDHFKSKGTVEMGERINETIKYIDSLKANIERIKKKLKDRHGASYGIQIHEMSPDVDVVLITGLPNQSIFYEVIRVLDNCGTDVTQANFSACGAASTFHVNRNKIEAADVYRRLNGLLNGSTEVAADIYAPSCMEEEEEEGNLDLWDFEICSDVWFRDS